MQVGGCRDIGGVVNGGLLVSCGWWWWGVISVMRVVEGMVVGFLVVGSH